MTSESTPKLAGMLLLGGMSLHTPAALALFEPGAGVALEYTDNAALTPDNEKDDVIALGYVGATIDQSSGPLKLNASTSLTYEHYTDNTFSDQHYFDLSATGGWEMSKDRLNWLVRDFFTQRLTNSLDRSTPSNIENVNIFNFGPDIALPISKVQKLVITPKFSDFYYQNSDTDNQQYSLALDWLYNTSATNEVGLGGSFSKTDFKDENKNPNFTASNVHAIVAGQLSRSKYRVNLGFTKIDRDGFKNESASTTGSLNWVLALTGRSNARVYVASDLTDSSYSALESAIDPGRGDINNVQISGDVFRNNILRTELSRKGSTLNSKLWAELRDLDYKETPQDRKVQSVGIKFDYQMRALVSSGLYARYSRTKRTDQDRTDKGYAVGGLIGYQLSRNLRTAFNLQYKTKNSTDNAQEYNEFSGLISLDYGIGEVQRSRNVRGSF
jgi:hypothetical protein